MDIQTIEKEVGYSIGDIVKYCARDTYAHQISNGDLLEVIDICEGMFPGRYYVTLQDSKGKIFSMYSYRVKLVDKD